jgi:uncharacterized protein (TIGR00375 family)
MQLVADLHLHSKYSRAVSPQMMLPMMTQYAIQKGLDLLTVSDWTHPLWLKEISGQLEETGEGVYKLKFPISNVKYPISNERIEPRFIFSTEISSIYKQGDKLRRIHNLVFVPSLEVAEKVNKELIKRGCNLNADGRPIIGLSAKALLSMLLEIDEGCMIIPAHIWTPHFGVYGSASGFESLGEAFGDLAKYIYGIETGLSSDPEMNWQIEELKTRSILSFSDAHSLAKMGREATVFVAKDGPPAGGSNVQFSYDDLRLIFMRKHQNWKIDYTIEFYPEEGKYHFSGHRNCKVVFGPEEIRKQGNACPSCGKRLTEGVLYRLQQLSDPKLLDRVQKKHNDMGLLWFTDKARIHPPYVKLVPLNEIIAEAFHSTVQSQKTKDMFINLCQKVGSEMEILLKTPIEEIARFGNERIAQGIEKVRNGDIVIDPGYDGEYGKVTIWPAGGGEILSSYKSPQLALDL